MDLEVYRFEVDRKESRSISNFIDVKLTYQLNCLNELRVCFQLLYNCRKRSVSRGAIVSMVLSISPLLSCLASLQRSAPPTAEACWKPWRTKTFFLMILAIN